METAETKYDHRDAGNLPVAERFALYVNPRPELPDAWVLGSVQAVLDYGRWIVRCPTDGCFNATYASETDRRFYCHVCGFGWIKVDWPDNRDEIEAELVGRPPAHQNWEPA